MGGLTIHQVREVAHPYRWRDRHGEFHAMDDMETRHIFHTVSMIWNHTMPEHARTHEYKRYRFGPFYTDAYMKESVKTLLRELLTRRDLQPYMAERLRFMRLYLLHGHVATENELPERELLRLGYDNG